MDIVKIYTLLSKKYIYTPYSYSDIDTPFVILVQSSTTYQAQSLDSSTKPHAWGLVFPTKFKMHGVV